MINVYVQRVAFVEMNCPALGSYVGRKMCFGQSSFGSVLEKTQEGSAGVVAEKIVLKRLLESQKRVHRIKCCVFD